MIEAIEPRRLLSTIYVDANATGVTHDGASWNSAYVDLQQGLAAAVSGDEIHVADGTYKPTSGTDRTSTFAVDHTIKLLGGFAGAGSPNPEARDPANFKSVLSGDIGAPGVQADNVMHVLTCDVGSQSSLIGGFIFDGGRADEDNGGNGGDGGGGIFARGGASLEIADCTFTNNFAEGYGGAIFNRVAGLTLRNCTFSSNNSNGYGGAICTETPMSILGCNFSANVVNGYGGAIASFTSTLVVTNSTCVGNVALYEGGAVFLEEWAHVDLINCTLVANHTGTYGGAVFLYDRCSATLQNCIVRENTATHRDPAIGLGRSFLPGWDATAAVTNSDIQGGWAGVGNIDLDPRFYRNPNSGLDDAWGTADDDYGDLRFQSNSPCIDAGNNAAVPSGVTTDLAGNPRIVDIPGVRDFGERVDMGAYEYLPALTYESDAAKPTLRMSFAFDVNPATLAASDLVLLNVTSGQPLSTSGAAVSYDSNTRIATWQFSGALPDGDYRATLPAGSVSDTSGTPLASDSLCNFFALAGDANRDRLVDIKDLYILASNWQGTGKLFSQGDFNYDGKVDAADLGILSARWQQNLAPPVAAAPVSIAKVVKRSPVRMVSVVG